MNDGDKALVVAEPTIIQAAERECSDVVPLYYPMAKAGAVQISPEALYKGMVAAWTGGNIGEISNQITKIWNSPNPDTDAVKILCMINNFVIDYAKTLYKPTTPPDWEKRIQQATTGKIPSFFQYAKGKMESQVAPRGNGVVDRLYEIVQIYKFKFNTTALGHFDYRMLMYDENVPYGDKEKRIVAEFRKEASHMIRNSVGDSLYNDDNQYFWRVKALRKKMLTYGSVQYITDVLIRGLFGEHHVRKKSAFWDCFGDRVYENLQNNLSEKTEICARCGKRFKKNGTRQYCENCEPLSHPREVRLAECVICGCTFKTRGAASGAVCPACKMTEPPPKEPKIVQRFCVDCGNPFDAYLRSRPSIRCDHCQGIRNRERVRAWKIKYKNRR